MHTYIARSITTRTAALTFRALDSLMPRRRATRRQSAALAAAALAALLFAVDQSRADVVYVASDFPLNNVTKFTAPNVSSVFGTANLNGANGLALDSLGNVFVSNFSDNTITKIAPDSLSSEVFASNHLSNPVGLAFDCSNDLLVTNYGDDTIYQFTPNRISSLYADSGLSGPNFLAVAIPDPSPCALIALSGTLATTRRRRN